MILFLMRIKFQTMLLVSLAFFTFLFLLYVKVRTDSVFNNNNIIVFRDPLSG